MDPQVRARQNDDGSVLSSDVVSRYPANNTQMLAVMLSRMKDCVPFGRTGYPFVFAIKVDDGRKRCRIGSAFHLDKKPDLTGKGGVRSSATFKLAG